MAEYSYCKKYFSPFSQALIDELIELNTDKEILDLATRINEEGRQVFNTDALDQINADVKKGYTIDDIKIYTIDNNGHSVYTPLQMRYISKGISAKLSPEEINIYARLNSNKKPVYDMSHMEKILAAIIDKIPIDAVKRVAELNKREEPIYDFYQMDKIFSGYRVGLDEEIINYYSQLNRFNEPIFNNNTISVIYSAAMQGVPLEYIKIFAKIENEKHVFALDQMDLLKCRICKFFKDGEIDKIKQIKDCVNEKLSYEQIKALVLYDAPAENIRIYRSLYKIGLSIDEVENLIKNCTSYEDLKEFKYLLTCANEFDIPDKKTISLRFLTIEEIRNFLATSICDERLIPDTGYTELIEKFLSFKLPTDQIDFLTDDKYLFSYEEMKAISIGFLNGITLNEMKTVVIEYQPENSSYNDIDNIKKNINELINNKINKNFDTEEKFDFYSESENVLERGE